MSARISVLGNVLRWVFCSMKLCTVEGCSHTAYCKGMCNLHYRRKQRTGHTNSTRKLLCSVLDCGRPHLAKGYCGLHYERVYKRDGEVGPPGSLLRKRGTPTIRADGYVRIIDQYEHILIAERALGKPLPKGAHVHHMDENPTNNDPKNLVICPDQGYHWLLHQRMKAYAASGHADSVKCAYCKRYDDPANNMRVRPRGQYGVHRECENQQHRHKRMQRKCQAW